MADIAHDVVVLARYQPALPHDDGGKHGDDGEAQHKKGGQKPALACADSRHADVRNEHKHGGKG